MLMLQNLIQSTTFLYVFINCKLNHILENINNKDNILKYLSHLYIHLNLHF